jgi:hypothetical protein
MKYRVVEIVRRTIDVDADSKRLAIRNCHWRKDWDEEVAATIVEKLPDAGPKHRHRSCDPID